MMRATISAILLCLLVQACGSKGALVMPPKADIEPKQSSSNSNKQN
jgi:predicted small lipoprotein YifL